MAAAGAVALAAFGWSADPTGRCLPVSGTAPFRWPDDSHLLVTGTADSIAGERLWAHDGWRDFTVSWPEDGPGALPDAVADAWRQRPWEPVQGQVVRLDRVGGAHGATLQALLDRGERRAVVVNWPGGDVCGQFTWRSDLGANVVARHSATFLVGRLRPRAEWMGALPTFDVNHTGGSSYPRLVALAFHPTDAGHGGSSPSGPGWLTPDQYMTVYEALPPLSPEGSDAARFASLIAWADANPDLARRLPAVHILEDARRRIAHKQRRRPPATH